MPFCTHHFQAGSHTCSSKFLSRLVAAVDMITQCDLESRMLETADP